MYDVFKYYIKNNKEVVLMFRFDTKGINQVNLNEVYYSEDPKIDSLCKKASDIFRINFERSINLLDEAMTLSEENSKDKAFILRRKASAIMSSRPYWEEIEACKIDLLNSVKYYEETQDQSSVIILERQRALALLCKVALDLKDIELLKSVAIKLNSLTEGNNPSYYFDSLRFLYQVYLANQDFDKAKEFILAGIEFGENNNFDISTEYRHLAKLNLLLLESVKKDKRTHFFKNQIEAPFWKCFDQHEKDIKNPKKINMARHALFKDFLLLLSIRLEKTNPEYALGYTIKLANRLIPNDRESYQIKRKLKKLCEEKITSLLETGSMPLSYDFPGFPAPQLTFEEKNNESKSSI